MNSLTKDSRTSSSGLSWRDKTLNSMSAPPMHLVALLGLVILLLSMSSYTEFKVHIEREKMGLKLLLYLLPLALFVVAYVTMRHRLPFLNKREINDIVKTSISRLLNLEAINYKNKETNRR
ncbi:hypothetical protein CTI12_AA459510 [Artemisia annua]|uniref:Uncharacterized protein n=1 Tax=Artemisia annua TaxID=35608 RepID=A0A2U1LLL5_ARTAN|nr:hypothetical protein CTI12_AA459510 [Artemisia annua]